MNFGVSDIGQFADVSVDFGDLTLLVGAQGTGKSIFLQLFKLSLDQEYVKNTMNQFGQDWNKKSKPELMEAYFGEGMGHIWSSKSRVVRDGKDAAPSPRIVCNPRIFHPSTPETRTRWWRAGEEWQPTALASPTRSPKQ